MRALSSISLKLLPRDVCKRNLDSYPQKPEDEQLVFKDISKILLGNRNSGPTLNFSSSMIFFSSIKSPSAAAIIPSGLILDDLSDRAAVAGIQCLGNRIVFVRENAGEAKVRGIAVGRNQVNLFLIPVSPDRHHHSIFSSFTCRTNR